METGTLGVGVLHGIARFNGGGGVFRRLAGRELLQMISGDAAFRLERSSLFGISGRGNRGAHPVLERTEDMLDSNSEDGGRADNVWLNDYTCPGVNFDCTARVLDYSITKIKEKTNARLRGN
jgi:hypothetical protein